MVEVVTILVSAAVLTGMIEQTRRARSLLADEQERIRAERDAFAAFSDQLIEIGGEPVATQPGPVSSNDTKIRGLAGAPERTSPTEQVKDAYRETVMAVDHYEEYDESLPENMRQELGPEVTTALLGDASFSPQLKQALLQKAHQAQTTREQILTLYEREAAALTEADTRLTDLKAEFDEVTSDAASGCSFEELVERWHHLGELEEDCECVLKERQQQFQTGHLSQTTSGNAEILFGYVYRSLPVRFPVLADGTSLLENLQDARTTAYSALTRRS